MRCLSLRETLLGFTQLALLVQASAALAVQPATIKIPDSTPVKLLLADRLSSANSEVDDAVHFEVDDDVKVRGIVVIPRGAMARGHVVSVQRHQRMGRAGKIEVSVDFLKAPDGTDIRLRAGLARQGKGKGLIFLVPVRMIGRGTDSEIPQGTHILAYVNGEREIAVENSQSPPATSQAAVQLTLPSTTSEVSTVAVTSAPDHADITVDGKFLGTTPSTVRLPPGDHSVTIEKSGCKAWQRVLTLIAGGNITLDVTLDKIP